MNWETLMCFGDSITIGARSYCGYPEYAGAFLEQKIGNKWNVVNFAVSGYTAMDLARYVNMNHSNLKQFEPGIISVMIGTNDIKKNTSLEDFKIAFNQVLLKAQLLAVNRNVFVIKIPSFPKRIMYPYNYKMNGRIEEFNTVISELTKEQNLRLIELSIVDNDLFDGVHLNDQGSKTAGVQLAEQILIDKGVQTYSEPEVILRVVNG